MIMVGLLKFIELWNDLQSFMVDDGLPVDRCYGETCVSVAMAFFSHSTLGNGADRRYADLLELYNAALAGMQLDGGRFMFHAMQRCCMCLPMLNL